MADRVFNTFLLRQNSQAEDTRFTSRRDGVIFGLFIRRSRKLKTVKSSKDQNPPLRSGERSEHVSFRNNVSG